MRESVSDIFLHQWVLIRELFHMDNLVHKAIILGNEATILKTSFSINEDPSNIQSSFWKQVMPRDMNVLHLKQWLQEATNYKAHNETKAIESSNLESSYQRISTRKARIKVNTLCFFSIKTSNLQRLYYRNLH